MREIRPSGSEGGVALTPPLLPLSNATAAMHAADEFAKRVECARKRGPPIVSFIVRLDTLGVSAQPGCHATEASPGVSWGHVSRHEPG